MEKVRAVWRLFVSDAGDEAMRDARVEITTLYDPHWATRNGVHYGCAALGRARASGGR